MKKNKELFNESSKKHSTWLCHPVYYKNSKLCIHNGAMRIEDWNKLKKYITKKCSPNAFKSNFCNFRLNYLYNIKRATIKFAKLTVIYELLMLQFLVVMGQDNKCLTDTNGQTSNDITRYLCQFCDKFVIFGNSCKGLDCGRNKNKDQYAEYGRFIMGPDGKVYDRLMMNPQMLQDGKIPEEMCQEGMQEQGMQGPDVQEPGMQETGAKEPRVQQTERKDPRIKESKLQDPDMNENEKKTKNKKSSGDYKNTNDDELHVGYKPL